MSNFQQPAKLKGTGMKNCTFALALMLYGSVACADDMPELAKKNCANYHAVEKNSNGPAGVEMAKPYKANNDAPVADRINKGGVGICGALPMPEQHVSYEEAKALARFVLGLSAALQVASSGH